MRELEYHLLDVFTDRPGGGNPVAVFVDAPPLADAAMQGIARTLDLSETVFVRPAADRAALRRLRIFTPAMELPFAGHPTIGTAQLLLELGLAPRPRDGAVRFALEEGVGLVPIEVTVGAGTSGPFTWLTAAQLPVRGPAPPSAADLAAVLGLGADDVLSAGLDAPRAYSAGVPFLYVPVRDRASLARVRVDVGRWRALLAGFWAPHVYVIALPAREVAAGRRLAARMFAPAMGIAEDPATGAAVAGLAGYLWDRERGDGEWTVVQGVELGRPSELRIELSARGDTLERVRVGGTAVRVGREWLRVDVEHDGGPMQADA